MITLLAAALALALPAGAQMQVKNPDTLTYLSITDPDSLDPAWAYDTASSAIILNVYEPLFWFQGSSLEKLDPLIAAKVPSRANGLITDGGRVYRIPIRKGIKFQDGTPLTPEDVRYSIVRFMLYDRDAGPSSLLLQPLLGLDATRDDKGKLNPNAFKLAEKAVKVQGDDVVLTLPRPYAPILTILAQWAPVVSKKWAQAHGGWDGTEATWAKVNNPEKTSSPFYDHADGSGPFKLVRWDRAGHQVILERNEGYWRAPAKLKRVIVRGVPEFATRKLLLQAGDADTIYATAPQYSQLKDLPGIEIIDDLPVVEMNPIVYFTFKINPIGNPYIGTGKLDGEGIPPDLFADLDVRKGFAYAMDYQGYIRDIKRGKGTQATGCIPVTLPGHNPHQKTYTLDLKQSAEHFKKALGGKLWDTGFRFTILYNEGNAEREAIAQMLKRNVESLNPKFSIEVRPMEWAEFLDAYKASKLPIFMLAWQADFPDPHNMAYPNMHSHGDYPLTQHYANPKADKLIDEAIAETEMAKRKELYYKVQEIEYQDVPHLVIDDAVRYRTQRSWVQGWVNNPVFPDAPYGSYFYPMWKGAAAKTSAGAARKASGKRGRRR